ncbi:hypothetical protein MTP99_006267 [Tenebrio molitor]|jgi:hypothetical protein|nr:hypothetical protein MTP99_006267 [Tenebrio molitor]
MAEITALSENACVFRAITVTGLSPFSSSRLIGAILFSRDKGDKAALSVGKSSRTLSSSGHFLGTLSLFFDSQIRAGLRQIVVLSPTFRYFVRPDRVPD